MVVVAIVGAYMRETVLTFLNGVLTTGGVHEVRLLQMGPSDYFETLVFHLRLVHDTEKIYYHEDVKDFLFKNKISPEVIIFMNSSFKAFPEFSRASCRLLQSICQEIESLGLSDLKILFADNYRGLFQQAIFEKLSKKPSEVLADTPSGHLVATVSSVFHTSKIMNSAESDNSFRSYPKADGGVFNYSATEEMSEKAADDLSVELSEKIHMMEKVFTKKTSSSFQYIEGVVLVEFMKTYIQSKSWDVALRDNGLCSRSPNKSEMAYYGLSSKVAVFLPPDDEGNRLPQSVKKHVTDASNYVEKLLHSCDV